MTVHPADLPVAAIRDVMAGLLDFVPHSKWYIFGSTFSNRGPANDIDLLVVCESASDCATVRFGLAATCTDFPIHLLLMTQAEETETNFIVGERAIELRPTLPAPI